MTIKEKTTEKIPSWAMCAIINGDYEGLTDKDIEIINKWLDNCGYDIVGCPSEDAEPYFTHYPAFGLPCDVYDCVCETI